jgi:hypothetical protein
MLWLCLIFDLIQFYVLLLFLLLLLGYLIVLVLTVFLTFGAGCGISSGSSTFSEFLVFVLKLLF